MEFLDISLTKYYSLLLHTHRVETRQKLESLQTEFMTRNLDENAVQEFHLGSLSGCMDFGFVFYVAQAL
jgi:hypothetical protein